MEDLQELYNNFQARVGDVGAYNSINFGVIPSSLGSPGPGAELRRILPDLDQRDRLQRPGGLGQVVQPLRQQLGETWQLGWGTFSAQKMGWLLCHKKWQTQKIANI